MKAKRGQISPPPARGAGPVIAAWAVLAALLVAGSVLRLAFRDVPRRTPDEIFYTRCAIGIVEYGSAFLPQLVRVFIQEPAQFPYPWPNRVGYMGAAAGLMVFTGSQSVETVALLSAIASLLSLILLWRLAQGLCGAWPAAAALAFLVASPLDLAIARRAWQDDVLALLVLAMSYACAHAAAKPERVARAAWFFVLGAMALLVKESALPAFALGTAGLAWMAWGPKRDWRGAGAIMLMAAVALAVAAAIVAVAAGGIEPLRKTYELARMINAPNEYMRHYQMGSPIYYAVGLGILDPVPFVLGLAAAVLGATRAPLLLAPWPDPRTRRMLVGLSWFVLLFAAIAALYPQKNLRFLSPIYAPIALLAGALVWAVLQRLRPVLKPAAWRTCAVAVALLLFAHLVGGALRFHHWFVERGVPDLATPWFTQG